MVFHHWCRPQHLSHLVQNRIEGKKTCRTISETFTPGYIWQHKKTLQHFKSPSVACEVSYGSVLVLFHPP